MDKLVCGKHKGSTKTTYFKVWRSFNNFVIRLDKIPPDWESRLCLYVTYLSYNGAKSSTIKSYVSGIKSILGDDGYELKMPKLLFNALTKSCRINNDRVKNRFPIQKGLMELILADIPKILNKQPYLAKLYQCMTILAYYGLLRIGELASGYHPVKAKDIHTADDKFKILLVLFTSKTHGYDRPAQQVKIFADKGGDSAFCPFKVTNQFLEVRGGYLEDWEPLFVFRDRSPVKPCHFRRLLRKSLRRLGLDSKLYDTHSLRIGRASDLMKFGYSVDQIKQLGRWKSNAVFKYIRN